MTAPVDVLAVMDGHADGISQAMEGRSARWIDVNAVEAGLAEFREARAAVAELIGAIEGYKKSLRGYDPKDATDKQRDALSDAARRLRAALARCGGAA